MEPRGNSPSPAAQTHDGFFKTVFSQPEHATAFFQSDLPPEVVARIDWPSLVVLPGSFIKSSLQQVHRRKSVECRAIRLIPFYLGANHLLTKIVNNIIFNT